MRQIIKSFTLIELIVVIAVLGILAAIIIPNIQHVQQKATVTAIVANIATLQKSIDMYSLDYNGEVPTVDKPVEFIPQPIDFSKIKPDYLRNLPKTKGVNYWVDFQNRVWGSTIDAPQEVAISNGIVTWEKVTGAISYQVFEVEGYKGVISSLSSSKVKPIATTVDNTFTGKQGTAYVINAIDEQGFQTAPSSIGYEGYKNPGTVKTNQKPIANIQITPSENLTTHTTIAFSSISTDSDGDQIVNTEWQIDSNSVVTTPPNGLFEAGTHIVKLRVKDSKGAWSDWKESSFTVIQAPPTNAVTSDLVITASGGYPGYDSPYYAFDGKVGSYGCLSPGTCWQVSGVIAGGNWVKVDFGEGKEKKVTGISLIAGNHSYSITSLKDWELYASNDDETFVKLTSGTQAMNYDKQTYSFTNNTAYRYYRINVLSSYGSWHGIADAELIY